MHRATILMSLAFADCAAAPAVTCLSERRTARRPPTAPSSHVSMPRPGRPHAARGRGDRLDAAHARATTRRAARIQGN